MKLLRRFNPLIFVFSLLVVLFSLAGCEYGETGKASMPSPFQSPSASALPVITFTSAPEITPTNLPTPTLTILGPTYDAKLDLQAAPVAEPIMLQIPVLKVNAPILGVGLTSAHAMDAPKGPYGDPVWHTAFWYRGSGIPGDSGTATIAAHVDDLVGRPEIFAFLKRLKPGDVIIIHPLDSSPDIHFIVDQVMNYSIKEATTPVVLSQIYGSGPVLGIGPQPSSDGLSHLTLITCAGIFTNGAFDHHTVVYATRSN
jgi:hypothetical protein